jgi:hypothetical protein
VRWRRQLLDDFTDDDGPGGIGQLRQFFQRIYGGLPALAPFMRYGQ